MKNIIDTDGLSFKDLFFFNKMITPKIITIVYWISLILIAISGLVIIFSSLFLFRYSFGTGLMGIISGILTIIVGSVFTRIGYELISILFNINKNIEKLASNKSIDNKKP